MEEIRKKILVVDDKPNNLSLVTSLLKSLYEVLLANNGERALSIAQEKIPDLILLDIMMPGMSGFEVCSQLKKDSRTENIPIIFLTARNDGDDFEKAYDIGAADYITKPINSKELLVRVRTHLLITEQRACMINLNKEIISMNGNLESEVQKRTMDLSSALKKLEKQNQDLTQFSNLISHNIRGPVATTLGLINLFNLQHIDDPVNLEIMNYLKNCVIQIDDILFDISGILQIRDTPVEASEEVNFRDILNTVCENLNAKIQETNATITISGEDAPRLMTVKKYLENIIEHLLNNALTYQSSQRNPDIKINWRHEDNHFVFSITDNGIGIDPNEWTKIFEPYKRLNYSTKGRGLGLYLVKTQVEAMNGRVEISSSSDQGSMFSIFLPCSPTNRSGLNERTMQLNNAFNELIA